MASVGTLTANIIAKTHGYTRPLKGAQTQTEKFGKAVENTAKRLDKTSQAMRRFGTVSLGLGTALLGAGTGLVRLASHAEETQSKFNAVFGNMASEANQWAEDFSRSVGRAGTDVRDWMATLQDTFVPLGFARDQASVLSKSLVELGVDVASFNNLADATVIDNFTSAIVGNHQAVRRYGIVLNEVTLQEELRRMGIRKNWNDLDEATKAQARYNVILGATRDAQGDAIRTQSSFANQSKALQSSIRDLGEEFGARLLAPGAVVLGWFRSGVEWLRNLDDEVKNNIVRFTAFTGALLAGVGVLAILGSSFLKVVQVLLLLGKTIALVATPFVAKLALIAGGAWLVYRAWEENWFGIRDITETVWKAVEPVLIQMWEWLGKAWAWIIVTAGNAWRWLITTTWAEKWEDIKGWLTEGWTWTITQAGNAWRWFVDNTALGKNLEELRQKIVNSKAWEWVIRTAGKAWDWIWGTSLEQKLDDIKGWLADGWKWTIETAGNAWQWLRGSWMGQQIESLSGKITDSSAWEWVVSTAGRAWSWIWGTSLEQKLDDIKGWFATGWTWIVETSGKVWDWIWGTNLEEKLDDIKGWFGTGWDWTIETVGDTWDLVKGTQLYDNLKKTSELITDSSAWKLAMDYTLPAIDSVSTVIKVAVEIVGDMYDTIRHGFETGDWAPFWGVTSDVWSDGVLIAIALSSVVKGISAVMTAITGGMGLTPMAGVLGALTIGIQLAEAQAKDDFRGLGANLITSLIAGLAVAGITGSPHAGVLTFTVMMNVKLGDSIVDTFTNQLDYIKYMLEEHSWWDIITNNWRDDLLGFEEWLERRELGIGLSIPTPTQEQPIVHAQREPLVTAKRVEETERMLDPMVPYDMEQILRRPVPAHIIPREAIPSTSPLMVEPPSIWSIDTDGVVTATRIVHELAETLDLLDLPMPSDFETRRTMQDRTYDRYMPGGVETTTITAQDVWSNILKVVQMAGIPEAVQKEVAVMMASAMSAEGGFDAKSLFGQFPGGQDLWLQGTDEQILSNLDDFVNRRLPERWLPQAGIEVPEPDVLAEYWEYFSALRLIVSQIDEELLGTAEGIDKLTQVWARGDLHQKNENLPGNWLRIYENMYRELEQINVLAARASNLARVPSVGSPPLMAFREGTPWTGSGPLNEVAGVVHRQESVIPFKVLKQGAGAILDFLGFDGFREGRVVAHAGGSTTAGGRLLDINIGPEVGDSIQEALGPVTSSFNRLPKFESVQEEVDLFADSLGNAQLELEKIEASQASPYHRQRLLDVNIGSEVGDSIQESLMPVLASFRRVPKFDGMQVEMDLFVDSLGRAQEEMQKLGAQQASEPFHWLRDTVAQLGETITGALSNVLGEERTAMLEGVFDTVKGEIQTLVDSFDYLKEEIEEIDLRGEETEIQPMNWVQYGAYMMESIMRGISQSVPVLNRAVGEFQRAIENGTTGFQALISSILGVLMQSEGFRQVLHALSQITQAVADVMGIVLMPVVKSIAVVWNAFMDALSWIPFINMERYKIILDDTNDSLGEFNRTVNEAMRNIPRGFRIASRRHDAVMTSNRGETAPITASSEGSVTYVININGDNYDTETMRRNVVQWMSESQSRNNLARHGVRS